MAYHVQDYILGKVRINGCLILFHMYHKNKSPGTMYPPPPLPLPWLQNVLIINSWLHWTKGGKHFRTVGIEEGGERVADVTRTIT